MALFWVIVALALLLWSSLAIFRAPNLPLFFFAVAATSFGHYLAAVGAGVCALNIMERSWPGGLLSVLATFLFLTPEIRARLWRRRNGFSATYRDGRSAVLEKKIEYGDGLTADFFFAEASAPRPLIVVVHGGGWVNGQPRECVSFLRAVARMGICVASVKYRLSPGTSWPGQGEDVLTGLGEILARAEEFHIDPRRVFLFGRSAGGQIASAVACSETAPPLAGCICFYTPFDMIFAYEHGREDDMLRSMTLLRQYLGGTASEASENYLSASAFHEIKATSPPFLIFHGTRDELVWIWQSRRMAEKIQQIGGCGVFHELPWATHAFDVNPHGPASRIALAAIQNFVFGDPTLASGATGERN